jgi:hypothetical protein
MFPECAMILIEWLEVPVLSTSSLLHRHCSLETFLGTSQLILSKYQ